MSKSGMERNRRNSSAKYSKDERKARRRRARHRIVIMQRVFIGFLAFVIVGGGGFAILWNLPAIRLERELSAAQEYVQEASYGEAIASYEHAIQIDSTSVKAYRNMASAYIDMEEEGHAKQILFEGWENTQDESLLQYYCTVILNEAVADINEDNCTLETVEKILSVLEQDANNSDALELMHTAYVHYIRALEADGNTAVFFDEAAENETCSFGVYEQLMNRLFALYGENGSDEVRSILSDYALIDVPEMKMSLKHVDAYKAILEKADGLVENESRKDLLSCLNKEIEIQSIFADMFREFDAGNYEAAKEFIVTDTYTQIRDAFIEGTMEYWNGETYIPVSRETVILKQEEGAWTFEFPDFKSQEDTEGIITVWGNKMTDDGIQRSCIAYEPAKASEDYYPHTEYVVSYMYSNVQKTKYIFEAVMNYHLETRSWTEEGMTTVMIGDWGGPYEWEQTY